MVRKRTLQRPGEVRLEECPFCDADDVDGQLAGHLEDCSAFRDAWGHDPRSRA